jgi:hypothetical protein
MPEKRAGGKSKSNYSEKCRRPNIPQPKTPPGDCGKILETLGIESSDFGPEFRNKYARVRVRVMGISSGGHGGPRAAKRSAYAWRRMESGLSSRSRREIKDTEDTFCSSPSLPCVLETLIRSKRRPTKLWLDRHFHPPGTRSPVLASLKCFRSNRRRHFATSTCACASWVLPRTSTTPWGCSRTSRVKPHDARTRARTSDKTRLRGRGRVTSRL